MGNSLNNAFARAYAKEQQLGRNTQSGRTNEVTEPQIKVDPKLPPAPQNSRAILNSTSPRADFPRPPAAPPGVAKAEVVETANSEISAHDYKHVEELRRRIDSAAAIAPPTPHLAPRSRESASVSVTPKSNSLTRRMQIAPPVAVQQQNLSPTLAKNSMLSEELALNQVDAEVRRKEVADYLYQAGQEPMAFQRQERASQDLNANLDLDRLMSSSIVDAWSSGSNAGGSSEIHAHRPALVEPSAVARNSIPNGGVTATSESPKSIPSKPFQSVAASSSLPFSSPQTYNSPQREALPASMPKEGSQTIQAPLPSVARPGEFMRLDIPVRQNSTANSIYTYPENSSKESAVQQSSSPPASGQPTSSTKSEMSDGVSMAVAQAEEKLRQARTRVFNPVWEVDELQWPEVCLQLLQKRAANLAEIAKHLKSACQDGLQVLAVASSQAGEGGSTVANCLAMLCAQHGIKIVLMDGNLDAPSLCAQTNLEIDNDWRAAIIEQMPLEEVAVHSIADQLTLVPLHKPEQPDYLLPSDQRIGQMIRELAESFDLVIVDVGSVGSKSALITNLARESLFDAAMIVVDRRRTDQQSVDNTVMRMRHAGVSSIGIIENFAA